MTHYLNETSTSVGGGLESTIRASWAAGSRVRILSTVSNEWVTAHIVTIHKDNLYCLLEDGDTKKIDRWDGSVQPVDTGGGDGEDDEDLFWMKDGDTPTGPTPSGPSMSLGFDSMKRHIGTDFASASITKKQSNILSSKRESIKKVKNIGNILTAEEKQFQKMCGYTIWVQWCDSSELHGYYHCVGLRNNRYHFRHRKDELAELFADDKGYWYLKYDEKILYKSKRKGKDDPPPRNWKCIDGSLPPPGVSMVDLPDDSTPMVIFDEEKKAQFENNNRVQSSLPEMDDTSSMSSQMSRMSTVQHNAGTYGLRSDTNQQTKHSKKKSKSKRKSKSKKNKMNLAKLLMDEFDVPIDVLDFHFDGAKPVAFHLNIARHMEVTKVKQGGQAEKLGVLQGDILLKIDEKDISKNWEKATSVLRSHVQNKRQFTITFVRRKVENLVITVVRAGNQEFNGKYQFHKRDKEDDMCPVYVKNDDEFNDLSGMEEEEKKFDPLSSSSNLVFLIQRVYCNPENSESLWVIRNGKDEHHYMCVTNEYLPPQHGWECVPDSKAKYPAPGLQFHSVETKFVTKMMADGNEESDAKSQVHDALNISNRSRTNKHQHEKTLTRMRATLGSASEFNAAAANSGKIGGGNYRSNTGGGGGIPAVGAYGGGSKKGGFGSRLFGGKKKKKNKQKIAVQPVPLPKSPKGDGNESASETEEDTAKIEAVWKKKLEQTTKNAINQLTSKHDEELIKKKNEVEEKMIIIDKLRNNLSETSEFYYQLYMEKCELSLILQQKIVELNKSKEKQKEMGKKYFQQQSRMEELESKMSELSESFSSRVSAIQSKPSHRPTPSTVNDLTKIEQQFRNLLKSESVPTKMQFATQNGSANDKSTFLEDEIISLKEKLNKKDTKMAKYEFANNTLKQQNQSLQTKLQQVSNKLSSQGGSEQFYAERITKLQSKVSVFQQNIYNLMSLLQNVEQEYMQKTGKLPKITKTIDWRNEYDPKKYKQNASKNNNGQHPTNPTFVDKSEKKKKKKDKKKNKNKNNAAYSATQSMSLPTNQRWSGWNLDNDPSGDDSADEKKKGKHRMVGSKIIDL